MAGNNRRVGVIRGINGNNVQYEMGEGGIRNIDLNLLKSKTHLTEAEIRERIGQTIAIERYPSNSIVGITITVTEA